MNVLKALLLTLVIAAAALAQTQAQSTAPAAPACLAGPVTQGNVTLSCSMVDATGGSDGNFGAPGVYLFAVKATSSDSSVSTLQIQLAYLQSTDPAATPTKRTVTALKSTAGSFAYVFILPPVYDSTGTVLSAPPVASITVQELKASSSQAF